MATNTVETNHEEEFTEEDPLREVIETIEVGKRKWHLRCLDFFKSITVEPCMLMFVAGHIINGTATQNLILEKACRVNLNYSDEICTSLKLQTIVGENEYEREAQKLMASGLAWKTYINSILPSILSLSIGCWSDKTGHRKMFIMIPIFGQFIIAITNTVNSYFLKELSFEYLVFSEAIVESLSGSWCIILLSIFSYISAITTKETRTFRIGIVNFCLTAGMPIGTMFGGIILKKLGYYGSYSIAGSIHLVNFLYTTFFLKDPVRTKEQKEYDKKGIRSFFRTFFDLTNIRDSVIFVFKSGPKHRRMRMITLLFVDFMLFGPFYGELAIMYINTRYRFNWDEVKYSIFQTYNFVLHTTGTIFSITVLSKLLQWHDSVLGILSTMSKILASFIYCFAANEKIFYIGPVVEIFNGMGLLAVKSIVSKLVNPDELGKVNSVFSLVQNTSPLIYVPIYTTVYTATMEVLPGAVFLMGSAMSFPAIIVFSFFWYKYKKASRRLRNEAPSTATPVQHQ